MPPVQMVLGHLFKDAGFATWVINADESDDPSDPALRLATMHRAKACTSIRCSFMA
ncbi:MAG: hypothetical protein HQ457_10820 [Betaproteobacteria bacterium]|nr:hypothetical protein [Betaproteobacteria bacterium]